MYSQNTDIIISSCGIGAAFCCTLYTLENLLLDKRKLIPIIKWNLPFYSENNDNNENIFDNYFELIEFPEISKNSNYIQFPIKNNSCSNNPRNSLNRIFKKHIKVKDIITQKVNEIFNGFNEYYKLGVHLRNTDRVIEPKYASPGIDKMLKHLLISIEESMKDYDNILLFIASDNIPDAEFIKSNVKKLFPLIVILEDSNNVRSPNQISVHGTHDSGLKGVSNSKKAESILTDIFSLSQCNKVLRSCSNVTYSSGIINIETIYIDISKIYGKFSDGLV
jgi:hypothetical protein